MKRILIIEDDDTIAAIERDYLAVNGLESDIATNGHDGLAMGRTGNYDLVLLDLMLPGIDGFTVCRKLRETIDIPILMVTARQEDIDKIKGLGLGADDYITKPFSPNVLVARIKANLAQYDRLKGSDTVEKQELQIGEVCIQQDSRRTFVGEREVELKNKEYELLLFLMMNPDVVFNKETLYERIWGYDAMGDNATVAVHINRLREKIEKDPSCPRYIETVWGAGYRFKP
ncbi:response regulator transcription factor [Massilioclostridium coli]|uniref:response regulator transcription factor n=1 Tax=Massilioclostridium coli TaxID=1870991 RepID=UPI0022E6EE5C|nr:response regulator transcription factor [Massilioclostridium coli]